MTWMIYGANGYTGELIARRAAQLGEKPILAGRNGPQIQNLADELGFPAHVFALDDAGVIDRNLDGVSAVVLAAGPFSRTSAPMREACVRVGVHYLDITGEFHIFEQCFADHDRAVQAGITLLPGVGFDVVPSDCLAVKLAQACPTANELELAFMGLTQPSRGTMRTMLQGAGVGALGRIDGKIAPIPKNRRTKPIRFKDKQVTSSAIPWGDISTAFRSTRIPQITVYMATTKMMRLGMALSGIAGGKLVTNRWVQNAMLRRIDRSSRGPDESQRQKARTYLWGCVRSQDSTTAEMRLITSESYHLTAQTAVASVRRVLQGATQPGTTTPAQAFGPDFIETFDNCRFRT